MTFLKPHRRENATVILAALLSLTVAGCGAGSRPAPAPTQAKLAPMAATPSTALAVSGGRVVSAGPLRAALSGESHTPTVDRPWRYSVKLSNAAGQPLSGTVAIDFLFAGQVVAHDKPPIHPITDGIWQSTLKLPAASVGYPLTLRAIAHSHTGSITLSWAITVRR